jgi:hypothetical protein
MPPWLIARIICVRALSGVDDDQTFRMIDRPATDRKAWSPIGVNEHIAHPRNPAFESSLFMPTLDLYVAYSNAVYFHSNTLTHMLHILALTVVILFTVSAWPTIGFGKTRRLTYKLYYNAMRRSDL